MWRWPPGTATPETETLHGMVSNYSPFYYVCRLPSSLQAANGPAYKVSMPLNEFHMYATPRCIHHPPTNVPMEQSSPKVTSTTPNITNHPHPPNGPSLARHPSLPRPCPSLPPRSHTANVSSSPKTHQTQPPPHTSDEQQHTHTSLFFPLPHREAQGGRSHALPKPRCGNGLK